MAYVHVIDAIKSILKQYLADGVITSYYEGDPEIIGKSSLPAICIMKTDGSIDAGPTGTDENTDSITIKVLFDKSDDFGATDNEDLTEKKLRLLMEDRDPVTGYWKPDTIIGILRTNYTLGGVTLEQKMKPKYFIEKRATGTSDIMYTSEAHLSIETRELVYVPSRQ